jgi:hypothetical protein
MDRLSLIRLIDWLGTKLEGAVSDYAEHEGLDQAGFMLTVYVVEDGKVMGATVSNVSAKTAIEMLKGQIAVMEPEGEKPLLH